MATNPDIRTRMTEAGLNLIQQALSIYDADLTLAVCNRKFREMFDLPDALVTPGTTFEDTIRFLAQRGEYGPVDNIEAFVKERVEQARDFAPHYMERTRANGRTISVEGSPLPQGGWVTVYTDITDIKTQERLLRGRSAELSDQLLGHAEKLAQTNRQLAATNTALEEAKRQLTEMEARTRTVTEMMPAHIAHVGPGGYYTYSNRRLSAVMPSRPSDIVGMPAIDALGEEAHRKIQPHMQRALAGESNIAEFNHDESGRRIRAAFTPDALPDGSVQGVYILSMDVTEEAQSRAALAQTRKRELAAQLTSGLAHDFANLLTIILGLQSRLERQAGSDDAKELILATQAAARRGGVLLDRIASISGQRQMRPVEMNVDTFLNEVQIMAAPSLPEGVHLHIRDTKHIDPILIDAGGLQDSLLNLILNARDAIGKGPGTIDIQASTHGGIWIEFTVQDSGPGFSPEALEHGMDPFFTTKGGEGSGLGLSVVYDLTKLAGGRCSLSNAPKGGGRVSLRLPLRHPTSGPGPGLVLLVEDSAEIREHVREMLTAQGHSVIEAGSADEALALSDLPDIDVILSDMILSGTQTGAQLLDQLAKRAHPATRLLMSSLPKTDARLQTAATRYRVLAKPFDAEALHAFLTQDDAQ